MCVIENEFSKLIETEWKKNKEFIKKKVTWWH